MQTKHFATDFQFTDCAPVNRSLPLEVQFTDESVACSRILFEEAVQSALTTPGQVAGRHYSMHSLQITTERSTHAQEYITKKNMLMNKDGWTKNSNQWSLNLGTTVVLKHKKNCSSKQIHEQIILLLLK